MPVLHQSPERRGRIAVALCRDVIRQKWLVSRSLDDLNRVVGNIAKSAGLHAPEAVIYVDDEITIVLGRIFPLRQSDKRRGEIAIALYRAYVRQEAVIPLDPARFKRKLHQLAQNAGVDYRELRVYVQDELQILTEDLIRSLTN